MKLIRRKIMMIILAISMLGTLNLSVQAAEKDTDFFEEYQDQETLKLYMQAYAALYNDTTYEYREMPEIDLAEYYADWNNTDSMFAQFHCHAMFAGDNKIPWNIEPWRTESNLVKVIAAKCNP